MNDVLILPDAGKTVNAASAALDRNGPKDYINDMKKINLTNIVWREGRQYVSWNLNTGVSSFSDTKKEALASLEEALELYFEDIPKTRITKVGLPDVVQLAF